MALGAERRDVLRLELTRALRIVVAGQIVGLAGAVGVTRVLQRFLFGVTSTDPIVFTVVTLLLLAVGLMAAWLPARRATRIDPWAALRAEEFSVWVPRSWTDSGARGRFDSCAAHQPPLAFSRGSPEVLDRHQVGSTADGPSVENRLTIR